MLKFLSKKQKGASLIEYALVAALIAIGSIAAMQMLSNNISTSFSQVGTKLQTTTNN